MCFFGNGHYESLQHPLVSNSDQNMFVALPSDSTHNVENIRYKPPCYQILAVFCYAHLFEDDGLFTWSKMTVRLVINILLRQTKGYVKYRSKRK